MLQFNRQVEPAVALVVAPPVVGDVLGTTQLDWQVDPWELQPNMQAVTIEVCASRIGSADAPARNALIASAAARIVKPRMMISAGPRYLSKIFVICPRYLSQIFSVMIAHPTAKREAVKKGSCATADAAAQS